jgi:hypothetical protein
MFSMAELEKLSSKDFSQHLNSKFKVHLHNGEFLPLELMEVADRESVPHAELFFLTFQGPTSPRLTQSTHRLEHEKLGVLEIFLTAIATGEGTISYEAVFHRVRKKA